jgi:hypothetical protein
MAKRNFDDMTAQPEQPELEPIQEQEQQPEPDSNPLNRTVNRLSELGIDPNSFVSLFLPVLEQMNQKSVETMRREMSAQVQQVAQQIIESVNVEADRRLANMNQPQQTANVYDYPGGMEPAVQTVLPAATGGNRQGIDINAIAPLLVKLMSGGNSGDNGFSSLKGMAETAKMFGEFYSSMMAPLVDLQARMRQNVLSEMTTYSKTGGTLPWELPVEEPKPRVELNQAERKRRIDAMARNIRLSPNA